MEKKNKNKLKLPETTSIVANSTFSDQTPAMSFSLSTIFDMDNNKAYSSSSLIDTIFASHPITTPSIFDLLQASSPPPSPPLMTPHQLPSPSPSTSAAVPESSEVVNTPATPNYSSISSSSTEPANNNDDQTNKTVVLDQHDHDDEPADQEEDKFKKELRAPKKKKQKREKEPRFAFMTKSDVDHLDDGFRWRKYGQKAVKHSPFPRSYYRCTTASCGVKKRVERSSEDPSIVVTTYEGTHMHPCPVTSRGSIGILQETTAYGGFIGGGGGGSDGVSSLFVPQFHYQVHQQQQQQQPYFQTATLPLNFSTGCCDSSLISTNSIRERSRMFTTSASSNSSSSSSLARDHGLLQDMVPSQMRRDSKDE